MSALFLNSSISYGDLPHQLFHKAKGEKWGDKLTREKKRYSFPWPSSLAGPFYNALYYVVVFTIMHIFSNSHSPTCKGNRVVKDGIQGRKETPGMFCLCFYILKIALEYTWEFLSIVMWDFIAFNTFGISPLIYFLWHFWTKNPLQTAVETNPKAALITRKSKKMHNSAMRNAGTYTWRTHT